MTKMVMVKLGCVICMVLVMVWHSPMVLRFVHPKLPAPAIQVSLPERVATQEQRIADIEKQLTAHETEQRAANVSERLATIESNQKFVLLLMVPIAVFLFTHTLEIIQRMYHSTKRGPDVPDEDARDKRITSLEHRASDNAQRLDDHNLD
jgi:uncharacterized coiled-coil protein SlyX